MTTAGSSGGTATAIAANLGAVGLGTDTGNSIRGPAAFLSLVGLRPTVGLVSRDGVVPLDPARDVAGPMTRTVADAARVLDVIAGAILVDPADIAGADALAQRTPRECRPFREALAQYLASLGPRAPVHSLAEIVASGKVHPSLEERFKMYRDTPPPETNDACRRADQQVDQLRTEVQRLLDDQHLDALVYPSWNNPPRLLGDLNTPDGSNGPRIASVVGFPAITVPMGFVRNAALPVGLEIMGAAWSEPRLIEFAYAYENATHLRRAPRYAPALVMRARRMR